MPKDDKRERILETVETLILGRRFHELTLDEVAEQARVGKGTIYRYFRDKDDLFLQMVDRGFTMLAKAITEADPGTGTVRERLCAVAAGLDKSHAERGPLLRVMHEETMRQAAMRGQSATADAAHEAVRERVRENREGTDREVAAILADGVKTGEIRTDLPLEVLAKGFMVLMRMRGEARASADRGVFGGSALVDLFMDGASGGGLR